MRRRQGASLRANFGQDPFAASVPAGFNAGWFAYACGICGG